MSIQSRARQFARDKAAGITKPAPHKKAESPALVAFNVTEFAKQANKQNHESSRADLSVRKGLLGAFGNILLTRKQREEKKMQRLAKLADKIAKQQLENEKETKTQNT